MDKCGFITYFWLNLNLEFMIFTAKLLSTGYFVDDSNCTFITLIPKKFNHKRLLNFQLISLVWYMYQVLPKVLVSHLEKYDYS